ncbi:MAG: LysR family transcriptional regulator, partial [Clostridiales bacterium]|nr:LysR family transcriptional regulator [Clostridiales bacterium]
MDLRQIRYFLTVAEERNITRAAERLHLSQPPLSRALMDLEEELGCTLIIRGKRHVTLTPEGLALKRRGEQILALADIAKTEITDVKKGLSGTLYLGHVDSNGPSLAAEWISSFKKEFPNVTYNLWCGTVDDL